MAAGGRFDLVVIGAGPGGYIGAIRAAQLGQKVAVVEEDRPGGVCLNWGCIPSKALLTGAELIESLRTHGPTFGVASGTLQLDYGQAIDHSRKVADRLCKGVQSLLKKNAITLVRGRGRLAGANAVAVTGADEGVLEAPHLVLATGSTEWTPPGIEVDGRRVLTSRQALESKTIPEKLVVIGAGAVGVEFAYVYANYGSQVTILEMAEQMLPGADPEVAQALEREFRRKKITVRTGTRFEELKVDGQGVRVHVTTGEKADELRADQVLVAIGRRPLSADLGLDEVGIETDAKGFVTVDAQRRTSVPSVRAIGDLIGAPLLAHKASEEGVAAAEWIAGLERPPIDHAKIPGCIYAQPQVAWIGLTEAQARERYGAELRVGRFPFTASGKAVASAHTAGFAKILAEPRFGEIVGAHLVGFGATELIAEISLAMTLEATTTEIAATSHAHPTLSEAILEAALGAEGRSLNF
ncbi:dihydrolipoyl dehydrogenase [Myxococcota bacterium]|nr:dihydrolipoyl dehydrogenase [Myxococcota bacterium]MCZ7619555.1 dihydrolipoyl dehydrogenase [Myxococcota bacterium]